MSYLFIYYNLNKMTVNIKCQYVMKASTCKLLVTVASVAKLGDQFSIRLENEDAARFIVYHNNVAISVNRYTLRTHELP